MTVEELRSEAKRLDKISSRWMVVSFICFGLSVIAVLVGISLQ